MTIFVDPAVSGDDLRQHLYTGNLVILTRLQALSDFVDYTREQLTELFKPHDPEHVHEHIDKPEMAKILGAWKPRFIHAERSKKLVRAIIHEAGFSAEETHYDLPKPRTSFPVGHLRPASPLLSRGTATSGTAPPPSRSTGGFRSSPCATTTP